LQTDFKLGHCYIQWLLIYAAIDGNKLEHLTYFLYLPALKRKQRKENKWRSKTLEKRKLKSSKLLLDVKPRFDNIFDIAAIL
jgi:hypothetical protein